MAFPQKINRRKSIVGNRVWKRVLLKPAARKIGREVGRRGIREQAILSANRLGQILRQLTGSDIVQTDPVRSKEGGVVCHKRGSVNHLDL